MEIYFFLGKGGVGKTTISASFATGISVYNKDKKILIASLDPAHNLGDAFDIELSNKVRKLTENLFAVEVDLDKMIKEYLEDLSRNLKNTYRYLTSFNLDRYFDILRYSPGIEEYAVLEAIKKYVECHEYDILVFDTPPTGITTRVLALPKLTLLWSKRLMGIRRKILDRRKMVENVKGKIEAKLDDEVINLTSDEREDQIMIELVKYSNEMENMMNLFSGNSTSINIVTMPEDLALFETKRIIEALSEFGIKIKNIYLNKYLICENPPEVIKGKIEEQDSVIKKMEDEIKNIKIKQIPLLSKSPRGIEELIKFYDNYILV
ncbi:MAG: ArsA family ATPase [Caldisericia bacterium]|nr:ArsA family ATPase [Caldisericia bacterium]